MKPSIGRIVLYVLNSTDAEAINKRRRDAHTADGAGVTLASQNLGPQIHSGNPVKEGDIFPSMVVRIFNDSQELSNLQVFLDGNDVFWATSVHEGEDSGTWHWPVRV